MYPKIFKKREASDAILEIAFACNGCGRVGKFRPMRNVASTEAPPMPIQRSHY